MNWSNTMMIVDKSTGFAILEVGNEEAESMKHHLGERFKLEPAHEYLPRVNKLLAVSDE